MVICDSHRNSITRKTTAQFLATLVERMGATKAMFGPRDISAQLMPAAARFVMDVSLTFDLVTVMTLDLYSDFIL